MFCFLVGFVNKKKTLEYHQTLTQGDQHHDNLFLSFDISLQTGSPEGPEDYGLCVSLHLLHHSVGISQAGQ